MPWTFAHPAAVLPLRRFSGPGRLSFAALVVGSMSPDFVYYVGRFKLGDFTHTPMGLLVFCLPAGLLALLLASWCQAPVARLLPQPHRGVLLAAARPLPAALAWRAWAMIAISLLLGAATHVVWDAFTHERQFFVQHIEALRAPLFTVAGREFRVCHLLQHASSLIGAALLVLAYRGHLRRLGVPSTSSGQERRHWWRLGGLGLAAVVCAAPLAASSAVNAHGVLRLPLWVVLQAVYSTTAFVVLLVAAAFWLGRR